MAVKGRVGAAEHPSGSVDALERGQGFGDLAFWHHGMNSLRLAQPLGQVTGAVSFVETVASGAFMPRTPENPYPEPCLA